MNINLKSVKGFTLVELMVTVAVIGIIVAVALPAYIGYIETSRKTEGRNNLVSLQAAETEFFSENGSYFLGGNTATLITNSGGLWTPAEILDADQNFVYQVVPGSTATIATSFTATATGRGAGYKVKTSVVLTVGN